MDGSDPAPLRAGEPAEERCGATTEGGAPCQARPLAGRSGRCYRHAGLAPTDAQREASAQNALQHGYYAPGLLDEEEAALFGAHRDLLDEDVRAAKRDDAALNFVRAMRVMKWEREQLKTEQGQPSPLTTAAMGRYSRALEKVEAPAKSERGLDSAELGQVVEALVGDPEVFLKGLPLDAAEEIRTVLRRVGRLGPA